MAAIMIRRTAWGVVASRSSTSAITTTDRMRENSTKLTPWSLEVSVLRKQAPAKKMSGAVRVDAIRTPRYERAASQQQRDAAMNVSEMRLEGLVTVVPAPPTTSKEDRRNRQDRTKSSKRVSARYTRPMPTMPPRTITAAWTLSGADQ